MTAFEKELEEDRKRQQAFIKYREDFPGDLQGICKLFLELLDKLPYQRFDGPTCVALHKGAIGDKENFVIWNNAGGQPFHAWIENKITKEFICDDRMFTFIG